MMDNVNGEGQSKKHQTPAPADLAFLFGLWRTSNPSNNKCRKSRYAPKVFRSEFSPWTIQNIVLANA
jgi:hypothetical protein